ncbi:MAG: replication initiator protein A [Candidatus Melainabacteria bacterium]|nr:replication initiator protein A [Candidatus Melainabacteria bacterium]
MKNSHKQATALIKATEASTQSDPHQLSIFDTRPLEEWRPVRDDFNFCRLALFVSSDKKADRFRNIRQTFDVTQGGQTFQVVWEVRHDAVLGLPSTFDRDVWLGLMDLIQEQTEGGRKPIPETIEIPSLTQFLKRIGKKSDGGKSTARVKESIKRLCFTTCVTEKAFNCPSDGGYLTLLEPLHLIKACAFRGDEDRNGGFYEKTWIKLGDFVRKNLDSGYIALLDVRFVQTLSSELAKQLYSYLSYRFWLAVQRGRDYTAEHWRDLAAYLAASGWDSQWRSKERLASALNELKTRHYIDEASGWSGDEYVFKIGDKFVDELRNRLKARDQYQQWVEGQKQVRQLTVLPRGNAPHIAITDEDERESTLMRQAIRLQFCRQTPDADLLARYGWTVQDVESMALRLKQSAK